MRWHLKISHMQVHRLESCRSTRSLTNSGRTTLRPVQTHSVTTKPTHFKRPQHSGFWRSKRDGLGTSSPRKQTRNLCAPTELRTPAVASGSSCWAISRIIHLDKDSPCPSNGVLCSPWFLVWDSFFFSARKTWKDNSPLKTKMRTNWPAQNL